MLNCSFMEGNSDQCVHWSNFLFSGMLAHWNTFVNCSKCSSLQYRKLVHCLYADKLLPVGVVPYCQTGLSLSQFVQVHYRWIGLAQWECSVCYRKTQALVKLQFVFLFLSACYPTFLRLSQSFHVCKDASLSEHFYWLTLGHCVLFLF